MKHKKIILAAIIFSLIVTAGMLLRFYNIEQTSTFGWDQGRDAYKTTDLLNGKITLEGPKTGIGNFHLGPLYFYLLAPFFLLTNFDPIASQYLNIFLCALTFVVIFFVTKKLFSLPFAYLAIGMYAINTYIIGLNRVPWNVSLVPLLSFLIFYFIYQTFTTRKYTWAAGMMTVSGLFFHAHFTAVVFPIVIILLWIVSKKRLKLLKLLALALPFYLIGYIPTLIDYFVTNRTQNVLVHDFMHYYFVGFHLQFVLHRLPDVVIQFRTLLMLPHLVDYLFILGLGIAYFYSKRKLEIKIIFAWIAATLFIFGIYGGPISDYYFFFMLPAVFYAFFILIELLFKLKKPVAVTILAVFLGYYAYSNLSRDFEVFKKTDGLSKQKAETRAQISKGESIPFDEGDIKSYLYRLYTNTLK